MNNICYGLRSHLPMCLLLHVLVHILMMESGSVVSRRVCICIYIEQYVNRITNCATVRIESKKSEYKRKREEKREIERERAWESNTMMGVATNTNDKCERFCVECIFNGV